LVSVPGYKRGKDDNAVIGADGNAYNVDWSTLQKVND